MTERQMLEQARKRAELKKKTSKIDNFVNSLEKQKNVYLEKAKDARERNETATYRLAKTGLNNTVSQLKRAKEMQLNLEITAELKNMSLASTDFLQTMGVLAKRISKLNKSTNFKKLNKSINAAIEGMQKTGMGLDAVMESTQSSFEGLSAISGSYSDEQLDSFIEGEISERELLSDAALTRAQAGKRAAQARQGLSNGAESGNAPKREKDTAADEPSEDDRNGGL